MTIRPLSICPQCRALRHSIVVFSPHGYHEHYCEACRCFLRAEAIIPEVEPDLHANSDPPIFHGKIVARCEP